MRYEQLSRRSIPCFAATVALLMTARLSAGDWPQWRGPTRDGAWHENGLIETFATARTEPRWRVPIGSGYCGPTVASGRVYVSDHVKEPEPRERIHCVDWKTGRLVWDHAYACDYRGLGFPAGPRACLTISDGRVYSLGAVGHLVCLRADTGQVLWKKQLVTEYQLKLLTWGVAASPLVDGDKVIVLLGVEEGECVAAFDKVTGRECWRALDEPGSYSSPIIIQQAGRRVLVCWTGASVSGLDPATGTVYWRYPFAHNGGWIDSIATPAYGDGRLFLSCAQDGARMLRLDADEMKVDLEWKFDGPARRNSDGLFSVIATPWISGGCIYGVDYYGQLRCLDAATGRRKWEDRSVTSSVIWGMAHVVRGDRHTWLFNDRGELAIADITPQGYQELSRTKLIDTTREQFRRRSGVCWSHPAFAYRHVFVRNDKELVCAGLGADQGAHDALARSRAPLSLNRHDTLSAAAPPELKPPFSVERIKESQEAWSEYLGLPIEYPNMIGMKCVLIPPGEFDMGLTSDEKLTLRTQLRQAGISDDAVDGLTDAEPVHRVRISRPFYISRQEVTAARFRMFVKWERYLPKSERSETTTVLPWDDVGFPQTGVHPAVNVSWNDAVAFCDYLKTVEGDECRLPTEAEWEYACRLGLVTLASDAVDPRKVANTADQALDRQRPQSAVGKTSGWDDRFPFTSPVGQFSPNTIGLYDMQGNVREWCGDWYGARFYARSPRVDPRGPARGENRVVRGGGWSDAWPLCSPKVRAGRPPDQRRPDIGFRVVQVW